MSPSILDPLVNRKCQRQSKAMESPQEGIVGQNPVYTRNRTVTTEIDFNDKAGLRAAVWNSCLLKPLDLKPESQPCPVIRLRLYSS